MSRLVAMDCATHVLRTYVERDVAGWLGGIRKCYVKQQWTWHLYPTRIEYDKALFDQQKGSSTRSLRAKFTPF